MMLSHPVLLGFLWSLLVFATSGQAQISSQDNKVYAYSYHFQHNGTTNSKDILRSVLGTDPELGFHHDGPNIVKTFSSPSIRGFFTKGVLPAGPTSHGFRSSFNSNPAMDEIKRVVQSHLQPPSTSLTRGLLPPVSPDIRNEFPSDFNNVNDIGLNFQKQDDFPKIPPPPPLPAFPSQDNFPKIPSPIEIQNGFPEIALSPPSIPPVNIDLPNKLPPHQAVNNNGVNKIEKFERNTPDGGKIVGQVERFSFNPPPVSNANSNYHENAEGFRRNENFVNNNQDVTGHRTQTYFRQEFRTVTPNLDSNSLLQNSRRDFRNAANSNNNNNQWWNVLNVLGEKNSNKNHNNDNGNNNNNYRNNNNNNNNYGNNNNNNNNYRNNNNNNNNLNVRNYGRLVDQNINQIKNNLHNQISRAFGSRLTNINDRQTHARKENEFKKENINNGNNNQNLNFNNHTPNQRNQPNFNIPFNNRISSNNGYNLQQNNNRFINNQQANNGVTNYQQNNNRFENQKINNVASHNQQNLHNQFNSDDTTRRVLNMINDVSSRLSKSPDKLTNEIGITWDDAVAPKIFNQDWSRRQSFGTGRPFSNGHSGSLNNPAGPKPDEVIKTSIEALVGGRELPLSPISNIGDDGNNYRNVGGGGIEKFFGVNRVVEGPHSYSQNTHRGVERNFHVNSNSGYQRTNQWSTNAVRRLDAQSTKDDFSKDFIDVFRDDY